MPSFASTCFYLFNHSFFIYAIFLFQFLLIFFLSFPHKLIPIFIPAFYSFHIPSLLVLILCRPILSPRFSFYHPLTDPPRKLSSLPVFPSALDGSRRGSIRVPYKNMVSMKLGWLSYFSSGRLQSYLFHNHSSFAIPCFPLIPHTPSSPFIPSHLLLDLLLR